MTTLSLQDFLKMNNALLIDIRAPFEHKSECIKDTQNIPAESLTSLTLPGHCGPVVFYCDSGMRSAEAVKKILTENPCMTVYSLENGLGAWKKEGLATQSSGFKVISIIRQVQIGAGSLVLTGILLGAFIDPWFYTLSGFVGAGLMFAGISGSCTMAQILSKMPWNR